MKQLSLIIKKLQAIFDVVIGVMFFICGAIFTFIMVAVCIDVITRYFFSRPMQWVIEISEYLLVYLTFLGTAWVLKSGGHVSVDILVSALRPRARLISCILSSLIGVLVCLVIVWYGTIETWDNFERGVRIPSILEFPKGPVLAIIPFGSFFLMLQFLRNTLQYINELIEGMNGSDGSES